MSTTAISGQSHAEYAIKRFDSGSSIITFSKGKCGLNVTIITARLFMRSVQATDVPCYAQLLDNEEVRTKYVSGKITLLSEIEEKINKVWARRWGRDDPYSAFAVFVRQETPLFVGHIILGHGHRPGESEFDAFGYPAFWQKKYDLEAATTIIREYAPITASQNYLLKDNPLTRIVATANSDVMHRLLKGAGMKWMGPGEKFQEKGDYEIDLTVTCSAEEEDEDLLQEMKR